MSVFTFTNLLYFHLLAEDFFLPRGGSPHSIHTRATPPGNAKNMIATANPHLDKTDWFVFQLLAL